MSSAPTERVVTIKQGQERWAREAFIVLRETAGVYNGTITYAELAQQVQTRTGLRTRSPARHWIGGILAVIVRACHQGGFPPLTSLVVHKTDGMVGIGYDEVMRTAGLPLAESEQAREWHAAQSRLECYRRFCDHVPEDAQPTLVTPARKQRSRPPLSTPATAVDELRAPVCPRCFIQLPLAGGECPNCY